MTMQEVYQQVETCRRKLLSYSFTSEELRKEAWAAEEELYALEEAMLKWSEEPNESPPLDA
jgi:hypothetical protein